MVTPIGSKIRIEIAPGADLDADPATWSWTDISEFGRASEPVAIQFGRADETGHADAAQCTVRLDNRDGRFSSRNPLGPWFGQLGLGTPLRVSWTDPETVRFSGLISELPTRWDITASDSTSPVRADGITRRMQQGEQPLDSAIFRSVQRAPNVVAYWPMEDGSDAESFASPIDGVSPMFFSGDVALAAGDAPGGSKPLPTFREESSFSGPIPMFTLGTGGSGNSWRADWVFRMDEAATSVRTILGFRMADSANNFIRLRVSDTTFRVQILDDEGGVVNTDDETVHADFFGQWLHCSLLIQGTTSLTYQAIVKDAAGETLHSAIAIGVGSTPPRRPVSVGIGTMFGDRRVGHVTISNLITSNSFDLGAMDGYAGERAAERFERLCDEEGLRCELIREDLQPRNANPGFEVDTSTWTAFFGTVTRSTAEAFAGVASGLLTPDGTDDQFFLRLDAADAVPVLQQTRYAFSAWVLAPDGWEAPNEVQLVLSFRNSGGGLESQYISDPFEVPAGVWTQLTMPAELPLVDEVLVSGDLRYNTGLGGPNLEVTDILFVDEVGIIEYSDSMPMGPQRPLTLTTLLGEIPDADQGILSEGDFGLIYRTRRDLYNQAAALALSITDGELSQAPEPTDDDQQVRNDVTVERTGGSSARVIDQAHIDAHGRYAESVTANVQRDQQTKDLAEWLLRRGTIDDYRWPRINLALHDDIALIPDWLALRLGDRITVDHEIAQILGVEIDQIIEGWSERLDQFRWDVKLNCSPAAPWSDLFTIEDDDLGRLGGRTYLAEDISDSATSFDVIVPVARPMNPDPEFEQDFLTTTAVNSSSWRTFDLSSFARTSEQAFRGLSSGKGVPDGTQATGEVRGFTIAGPGLAEYMISAWLLAPVGTIEARLILEYRQSLLTVASSFATAFTTIGSTWTRLRVSGATHPSTSFVTIRVQWRRIDLGTLAATDVLYVDDAELGEQGAPWITDAEFSSQLPVVVRVGGEVMSVAAIGAPTDGVQTFSSVTRSVNGVTKPHMAGTDVELHPSPRLAL